MGQIIDKFRGDEWKQRQIRKISDRVFDRIQNDTGQTNLRFEDLYITVLLVYNDLNKRLPGPHLDPPSKKQVRDIMLECDINLDGELDREEFVRFIKRLTKDTFIYVSQGLIITLAVAPTVAVLTKRATEGVPGVGVSSGMKEENEYLVSPLMLEFLYGSRAMGVIEGPRLARKRNQVISREVYVKTIG